VGAQDLVVDPLAGNGGDSTGRPLTYATRDDPAAASRSLRPEVLALTRISSAARRTYLVFNGTNALFDKYI